MQIVQRKVRHKGEQHEWSNSSKFGSKPRSGDRGDDLVEFKSFTVMGNIARVFFLGICNLLCDFSQVREDGKLGYKVCCHGSS